MGRVKECLDSEPENYTDDYDSELKVDLIIQKLMELKHQNHHVVDEEIWRIDEIIKLVRGEKEPEKDLEGERTANERYG